MSGKDPVLAARVAGQGLAARRGGPLDALRSWAVQDSPPGSAVAALVARAEDVPVGWLDDAIYERRTVVALYNPRSATALLPAEEAAAFGTAFLPADDDGLRAIVATALPDHDEGFAEPVALAVDAISDALDGVTLSRDDLHERLRQRLPKAMLPWCRSCQSHHARRGLLIMATLRGRLCIAGRVGRQPAFARTDQLVGWEAPERTEAGAELVRRYLRGYGPSTPQHFAQWAGLGTAHARELWALAEYVESDPRRAEGVRLLATGDPLLLGRDRERLVPDPEARKKVWAAVGGAGVVLADGVAAGLWRGRKHGKVLDVELEGKVPRRAVQAEAERLAPHRGCTSVEIRAASGR